VRCQSAVIVQSEKVNKIVAEKVGEQLFLDIAAVFEETDSDASVESTRKG
jgi:hypothetical protein